MVSGMNVDVSPYNVSIAFPDFFPVFFLRFFRAVSAVFLVLWTELTWFSEFGKIFSKRRYPFETAFFFYRISP